MSEIVIKECFNIPSAPTQFDPEQFLNWWTNNAAGTRILTEALAAYKDDSAGQTFSETIDTAAGLYNSWDYDEGNVCTDTSEGYSADTEKLLKVLSSKVFSHAQADSAEPARILVAGDVQSGKTSAYTDLIKALLATRGIRSFPERYIFLVLGGVHNKLRRQTQGRLDAELAAHAENSKLVWLTSREDDLVASSALSKIKGEESASYIAVVKKVTSRLDAAAEVFDKLPAGNDFAVVIIDDECDQITPDTRKKEKRNSRRMASLLWGTKSSSGNWSMPEKFSNNGLVYIGYTATPYSNVFLDEKRGESMYPSTYMYVLTPGEGYMGYDHYWPQSDTPGKSKSIDVFKALDEEIDERRRGPDKFKVSETALEDALLWFLVAACIKRERLGVGTIAAEDRHTSMLVHAHVKVADHVSMREAVNTYMRNLTHDWLNGSTAGIEKKLLRVFDKAKGTEDRPASTCLESNAEVESLLQKHLTKVLSNLTVVCDNSRSKNRLEYPDDRESNTKDTIVEVIAVGGYTLSRGITLRGLVSSYVSRITKVVYDTYLQLCRWFGYRHGYGDLTRLWVAGNVSDNYADIARVDRQFKKAITAAGLDPEGPYGHGQIYLGTVVGALPSNTLDSLIRSTAFKDGTPHGNRLFGTTQAWADTDVNDLLASGHTGADVADFLEKYNGQEPDRNRMEQLVNFIRENKDLLERDWDVTRPVKSKDSAARFERGIKEESPSKLLNTTDWYIKTPTDKNWRTVNDRPLLLVAPALIYPPIEVSTADPRPDWIVAAIFDKRYGPAEVYLNDSIALRDNQQEEFGAEDVDGDQA